jgi:hypothetical protein
MNPPMLRNPNPRLFAPVAGLLPLGWQPKYRYPMGLALA